MSKEERAEFEKALRARGYRDFHGSNGAGGVWEYNSAGTQHAQAVAIDMAKQAYANEPELAPVGNLDPMQREKSHGVGQ